MSADAMEKREPKQFFHTWTEYESFRSNPRQITDAVIESLIHDMPIILDIFFRNYSDAFGWILRSHEGFLQEITAVAEKTEELKRKAEVLEKDREKWRSQGPLGVMEAGVEAAQLQVDLAKHMNKLPDVGSLLNIQKELALTSGKLMGVVEEARRLRKQLSIRSRLITTGYELAKILIALILQELPNVFLGTDLPILYRIIIGLVAYIFESRVTEGWIKRSRQASGVRLYEALFDRFAEEVKNLITLGKKAVEAKASYEATVEGLSAGE